MQISRDSLRRNYQRLEDHELVELRHTDGLTEEAIEVLDEVLSERQLSTDELDLLSREHEATRRAESELEGGLAPIGTRLLARLVDYAVFLLILAPTRILAGLLDDSAPLAIGLGSLAGVLYLLLADGFEGRGVGKRFYGIAVVDVSTGRPCGFVAALLRRVPGLLGLIDLAFALGKRRQRLGDMIANTHVVTLSSLATPGRK